MVKDRDRWPTRAERDAAAAAAGWIIIAFLVVIVLIVIGMIYTVYRMVT